MDAQAQSMSKPFTSVLFSPLARRDNPAAMRRILEVIERDGASLTVVGVIPEPTRLQRMIHGPEFVEQALSSAHEEMSKLLGRCLPDDSGLDVPKIIDVGNTALSIVTRAVAAGHDLVVVTSDEDDEDRGTIKRLLRKCPSPVWVIRPTRAKATRVLAAVNPEPDERELNQSILEMAASLATGKGAELHVVHAWELYGESTMLSSAFLNIDDHQVNEQRELVRRAHDDALRELIASSSANGTKFKVHLAEGEASRAIIDAVKTHRINQLVMGTVARTGLSGLVMGNTAERVFDVVTCSVLAVKPPHFVSPVHD